MTSQHTTHIRSTSSVNGVKSSTAIPCPKSVFGNRDFSKYLPVCELCLFLAFNSALDKFSSRNHQRIIVDIYAGNLNRDSNCNFHSRSSSVILWRDLHVLPNWHKDLASKRLRHCLKISPGRSINDIFRILAIKSIRR